MASSIVKIAAVAVVAVVAISAVAILVVSQNNKDSSDAPIASPLMVRGNADNNYKIDSNDMSILEDIISGDKKLEDYPLADINGDDKVDDADKAILQDMLDHKSGMTMYVQTLDRTGKEVTAEVTYPLRNVVTFATNMEMPVLYAGGGPYEAGYFTKSYTNAQASVSADARNLNGSQRSITDDNWTSFTTLDADLRADDKGGVGALLVDYSGISQITQARANDLAAAHIPMLAYKSADCMVESATVITLSYLFGTETEEIGQKYAQLSDKVIDKVKSAVGEFTDEQKTTYLSFTMYIYICQNDSTFNTGGQVVYGLPYYKTNPTFADKYKGSSSTIMSTVEALSNYTDVMKLINNRSMDWNKDVADVNPLITETWDHSNAASTKTTGGLSSEYFHGFEDKLFYMNNLLPGPAKMAYLAAMLYPEEFCFSWADGILQECIDMGLAPLDGYTVEQIVPYFGKEKYDAAKAASA